MCWRNCSEECLPQKNSPTGLRQCQFNLLPSFSSYWKLGERQSRSKLICINVRIERTDLRPRFQDFDMNMTDFLSVSQSLNLNVPLKNRRCFHLFLRITKVYIMVDISKKKTISTRLGNFFISPVKSHIYDVEFYFGHSANFPHLGGSVTISIRSPMAETLIQSNVNFEYTVAYWCQNSPPDRGGHRASPSKG